MQPKNWARNILRTSEKLQNVVLTSLDFEEVIDNAPDGSLLFVDPPYFNADQDKFYQHFFDKFSKSETKKLKFLKIKADLVKQNPEISEEDIDRQAKVIYKEEKN